MNPRAIEELGNAMGEVYEAVVNRILINLAHHFPMIAEGTKDIEGAWQYQVTKLAEMGQVNRETEQIILSMLKDADEALQTVLENAIINGLKDAEKPLRDAAEKGLINGGVVPPMLAPNQMQAFQSYYRQSADHLNLVNTVMLESTRQAYQATVSDIVAKMEKTQSILNTATGEVVTGVTAMNSAVRSAVKKMVVNGITGYIDHAGRRWSPEGYVTMDIRTTVANAARDAVTERMNQYGSDLYQVSYHDGARPLCYPWQGKVISRTGQSGETEDGQGNKVRIYAESETSKGEPAGLFGINCGHYPIPFFPGYSRIRPPAQNEEENAKEYELSQKQRALERKLRNEKRDLAVLKAQGASEEEIAAQRERVRAADAKLDDFSSATGRARRKSREYTPIKPTFPDKDTYDPKLFDSSEKREINQFYRGGGTSSGSGTATNTGNAPMMSREEYKKARAERAGVLERTNASIDKWYDDEKARIKEEYGGPFLKQRIAIRSDGTLSDLEKQTRLEQLKAKETEMKEKLSAVFDEYSQKRDAAYKQYSSVFIPEYEYPKINGTYTIRDNAKSVNPNWSLSRPEYTVNCQRCGVAYELRARGFNVEATAAPEGGVGAPAIVKSIFSNAEEVQFRGSGHENTLRVREQLSQWGDGARGIVIINRSDGSGHVFNVAQSDGHFWIIDSQLSAAWNDIDTGDLINGGCLEEPSTVNTTIFRTDNTEIFDIPEDWIKDGKT